MKSRTSRIIVGATGFAISIPLLIAALQFTTHAQSAQTDESLDRKNYSDQIKQTFNFRFGNAQLFTPWQCCHRRQ